MEFAFVMTYLLAGVCLGFWVQNPEYSDWIEQRLESDFLCIAILTVAWPYCLYRVYRSE